MNNFALVAADGQVERTIVLPDDQLHRAEQFIAQELGLSGTWLACDTNAWRGKNRDGAPGPAFRKNYPTPGYTYDPATDSFVEPKPVEYPSWVLDSDGAYWKPPVPPPSVRPQAGHRYQWDEASVSWAQVPRTAQQPSA